MTLTPKSSFLRLGKDFTEVGGKTVNVIDAETNFRTQKLESVL